MNNELLEKFITEFTHPDARAVVKDLFTSMRAEPEISLKAMFNALFDRLQHGANAERNGVFNGFVMGITLVELVSKHPDLEVVLHDILAQRTLHNECSNVIHFPDFTKGEIH